MSAPLASPPSRGRRHPAAAALVLHLPLICVVAALPWRDLAAIPPAPCPATSIGRVDVLTPCEIRVSDVSYCDDRDDLVVDGATVIVRPACRLLPAILSGAPFRGGGPRLPRLDARAHPPRSPSSPAPRPSPRARRAHQLSPVDPRRRRRARRRRPQRRTRWPRRPRRPGPPPRRRRHHVDLRDVRATVAAMGLGDEVVRARACVVSRAAGPRPASVALDAASLLRGASVDCGRRAPRRRRRRSTPAPAAASPPPPRPPHQRPRRVAASRSASTRPPSLAPRRRLRVRATAAANAERVDLAGRVSATHQVADVHRPPPRSTASSAAPALRPRRNRPPRAPRRWRRPRAHRRHRAPSSPPSPTLPVPRRGCGRVAGTRVTVHELSSPDVGSRPTATSTSPPATPTSRRGRLETREFSPATWVRGRASARCGPTPPRPTAARRITARPRRRAAPPRGGPHRARRRLQATATHERVPAAAPAPLVAAAVTARGLQVHAPSGPLTSPSAPRATPSAGSTPPSPPTARAPRRARAAAAGRVRPPAPAPARPRPLRREPRAGAGRALDAPPARRRGA